MNWLCTSSKPEQPFVLLPGIFVLGSWAAFKFVWNITPEIKAEDLCEILKEVFNSDSFTFRGITGKTEGTEKSTISWSADGTVQKEAIKYIVKEATN